MPTVETIELGLNIGTETGEYYNTEIVDGKLQLKQIENSDNFEAEGYWETEVIDLEHKFKEYQKVLLTGEIPPSSQTGIEVRMSDNGVDFTPYQQTAVDGTFQSPVKRYIQIKVNLYVGYTPSNNILDFKEKESLDSLYNSYFFESGEQGLKINSSNIIDIPMAKDSEYNGGGYVYAAKIDKNEFIADTISNLYVF